MHFCSDIQLKTDDDDDDDAVECINRSGA